MSRLKGKLVACAAVLLIGVTALAGCTGSDSAEGSGTELRLHLRRPSGAYQEAATKCSEESDGEYTISFEFLPAEADAQREQLVRRLGAEDDSIDIVGMDVIWTAEFANAGFIEPWAEADEQTVTKGVFDSVVESAWLRTRSTPPRSHRTRSFSGTARTASTRRPRPGTR